MQAPEVRLHQAVVEAAPAGQARTDGRAGHRFSRSSQAMPALIAAGVASA